MQSIQQLMIYNVVSRKTPNPSSAVVGAEEEIDFARGGSGRQAGVSIALPGKSEQLTSSS